MIAAIDAQPLECALQLAQLAERMPSRTHASRRALAALLIAIAVACFAPPARACPGCEAARVARSEIFGAGFFRNLAVAVLPFVIIGAVCLRLQNLGRRP